MNFKKIFKYFILVVAIIFALDAGLIFTMAHWQPEAGHADAIIVLGAAINTPALTRRTLDGLTLYQQGKADRLILSGGKIADSDIAESEFMAKVINSNTANPVNYIIEDQSHNTYENIKNSKIRLEQALVEEAALPEADSKGSAAHQELSAIIVSDKYHIARAVLLAKRAGFETVHWHSPDPDYYPKQELHYYYFREFIAMLNYIPKFIFG